MIFFELVEKRISWGEARIFPECSEMKCEPVENLKEKGLQGEMYKKLNQIQKDLDLIKERFGTTKQALKIYTDPEKEVVQKLGQKLKEEQNRIKRDLKVSEKALVLFGFGDWRLKSTDFDFSKFVLKMRKLKITKEMFIDVIYNPNTVIFNTEKDFNILDFTKNSIPLYSYFTSVKGKFKILELNLALEDEIKYIYFNDWFRGNRAF